MSDVVGEKKFYFTAVPVDALGNYDTTVSLYEANYTRIDSDNDGYNDLMDISKIKLNGLIMIKMDMEIIGVIQFGIQLGISWPVNLLMKQN